MELFLAYLIKSEKTASAIRQELHIWVSLCILSYSAYWRPFSCTPTLFPCYCYRCSRCVTHSIHHHYTEISYVSVSLGASFLVKLCQTPFPPTQVLTVLYVTN